MPSSRLSWPPDDRCRVSRSIIIILSEDADIILMPDMGFYLSVGYDPPSGHLPVHFVPARGTCLLADDRFVIGERHTDFLARLPGFCQLIPDARLDIRCRSLLRGKA